MVLAPKRWASMMVSSRAAGANFAAAVGPKSDTSAQPGIAPRRIEAERETGLDPLAAGYGDEIHELIDQTRRACIVPGRPLVGKQEARGARDEGPGADPAQDEGGEHAPLRVEDEIEATIRQRPAQQLRLARTDAGILNDLVERASDQRRQRMRVDGRAFAGQPGDARLGPAPAERADERQLHHAVAEPLETGIDQYVHGARSPCWAAYSLPHGETSKAR